jgi:hypothetical protein
MRLRILTAFLIATASVSSGVFFTACGGSDDEDAATEDSLAVQPETFSDPQLDELTKVEDHEMKAPVQQRLTTLMDIAKSGKFKNGTEYLAYRGNDSFHASNEIEREVASYSLQEIKDWLGKSGKYQFGNFYLKDKDGKEWYVQDILFDRDGKPLQVSFWMLDINGSLAIGEMK